MQENNTQAAIDAGKEIASAVQKLQFIGEIPVGFKANGDAYLMTGLLAEQDRRADKPRALAGSAKILDEASMIAHCQRFRDLASALFADASQITAVYDYHRPVAATDTPDIRDSAARWQRHRAIYTPSKAKEWTTWTGKAGQLMSQADFADFLEANLQDLAGPEGDRKVPSPADLMTLALTLKVTSEDVLESQINRTTGEYHLVAKVEQKTTGEAKIPKEFDILVPVYENGDLQRVTCRFRMKKDGSTFKFGWVIPTAERLERSAWQDICKRISEKTSLPLIYGQPEQ
jgi:uncharacterized protein YfdQ (DUF2303 family)